MGKKSETGNALSFFLLGPDAVEKSLAGTFYVRTQQFISLSRGGRGAFLSRGSGEDARTKSCQGRGASAASNAL